MMLIIFDVDGTLVGGEEYDWKCFNEAFLHVTGKSFSNDFWKSIEEVTASSIVHQGLTEFSERERNCFEESIRQRFLKNLKEEQGRNSNAFSSTVESRELLYNLSQSPSHEVAIATGDWLETIDFKLNAAGIRLADYPHATASDTRRRADIIRLAAERCGQLVEEAVYVGDGHWDLRACEELAIPFIGTGNRVDTLKSAGALWTLQKLDSTAFFEVLAKIETSDRSH